MYFTHKKSIVKVEQINEPFTVFTIGAEQFGDAGDYLSVSLTGEREVLPKEVFDEEYVAVQLVEDNIEQAYKEVADIYKDEADAGVYTYNDGMFQSNKAF